MFQIKILNDTIASDPGTSSATDCEKADLDSCEKERSDTNLNLPIPSASTSMASSMITKGSPCNTPIKSCPFKEECEKFKKKLCIPDHYFAGLEGNCFCATCLKFRSQAGDKDNTLQGY